MRLYTRTGDKGETQLIGGARVAKHHPRVIAYGSVDELNAAIGWAAVVCHEARRSQLYDVQDRLFVLGAELATPQTTPATPSVTLEHVTLLERWMDAATDAVSPLKNFILPGGSEAASRLHVARTICRRAEREVSLLQESEAVAPMVLVYLNRLSDLLFAWARVANADDGVSDVVWPRSASDGGSPDV